MPHKVEVFIINLLVELDQKIGKAQICMHTTALHLPKTTCHKPPINRTGSSNEPPMNLLNRTVLCLSQMSHLSVQHFFHILNYSLAEKNEVTFVRRKKQ